MIRLRTHAASGCKDITSFLYTQSWRALEVMCVVDVAHGHASCKRPPKVTLLTVDERRHIDPDKCRGKLGIVLTEVYTM